MKAETLAAILASQAATIRERNFLVVNDTLHTAEEAVADALEAISEALQLVEDDDPDDWR